MRKSLGIGVGILIGFLGGVGSAGYAVGRAQVRTQPTPEVVLQGGEVGFRMVGTQGDRPVGQWVVKIDGKWVAPAAAWEVKPVQR